MKAPLLSICIATYNRAGYIGETLDSIIPQLDDEVEVLVVDGASTDDTENVVRKYTQTESHIRYVRLPSKGGVDQDYDKSVELSRGEFCWFFTDDDLLRPGAVVAVKTALKGGYDLVIINAELRDRKLSTILQRQRIVCQDNKVYLSTNMESLFIDAAYCLSFIGSVVIRRSLWLSRDRASYFGTEFVHIGVIFQEALATSALLISEPYIIIRLGNSQWMPRSFDVWMFKWPELIWSFNNISSEARLHVTPREPWRNFKHLLIHRSLGGYNIQSYYKRFSNMKLNLLWKLCAWFIARFPRKIIVPFHYFYGCIKRRIQ